MIPVLPWYCHNMVLMVWCLSGIVTVSILAIFRKPLILSPEAAEVQEVELLTCDPKF
jgi:hypothetical protein